MSGIDKLKKLKLVVFDVDGIFTDGRTWQDSSGSWRRYFSVRDTMGIRALRKAGYKIAVISAESANEIRAHVSYVGVDEFFGSCANKPLVVTQLLAKFGVNASEAAFMTADESDLDLFGAIGFSVTVPSAPTVLQSAARYVTSRSGGDGAVLEVCNLILQHTQHTAADQSRGRDEASL